MMLMYSVSAHARPGLPALPRKFSSSCEEEVLKFYSSLEKGLENLERAAAGADFISFSFVSAALDFLRCTHAGVIVLIDKLRLPVCAEGGAWLNEYMDETVKLLDVSNALKTGIVGLENYQVMVQEVVRTLDLTENFRSQSRRALNALNACRHDMRRLEHEHRGLMDAKIEAEGKLTVNLTEKHVENNFGKWNGFWGVWFTVKNTDSYICRLILSAVVCLGPIPSLTPELVSVKSSWLTSLLRLHSRVVEEVDNRRKARKCAFLLSSENEAIEGALADLRTQLQPIMRSSNSTNDLEKLRECVRSLMQGSSKFLAGAESVDWHLNDLFDEIVEGRNKVLNMCSNVTWGRKRAKLELGYGEEFTIN